MMHTIHVDHVLREAVNTPYRNLVTRATGAAVRTSIEQAIADTGCETALLDFSEVDLVDFSCAEEIVAKLLLAHGGMGRFVMLQGLRDGHLEPIEHVLNHHALAILVRDPAGGTPRVLGRVSPELRRVLVELHRLGPLGAGELAERLDWPEALAREALDTLARLRLLRADDGAYHPLPLP